MKKITGQISLWIFLLLVAILISQWFASRPQPVELDYSEFKHLLKSRNIVEITISPEKITGKFRAKGGEETSFKCVPLDDPELIKELEKQGVAYRGKIGRNWLGSILVNSIPFIIFLLLWIWIVRSSLSAGGRQAMSFGKSTAKLQSGGKPKITFADVAGIDEAKEELQEIISFLKDPKKYQALGGKIPKGVLLYGIPGCGKTLLAKAVAGEAGVPFFSISGSDFVEMFVGVGASRVRDLFEQGRRSAPCLVFIDEIDAVGRRRFAGIGGGHDEREQTLNQLLAEMDGFDTKEGVILIAATNRPDVLDPALLRTGRFDRQIAVPNPDLKGRKDILKVHTRNVKLASNADLEVIARRTVGFAGSDLANLVNEAALLAARMNKKAVELEDLEEAIDRVIAGPERKSRMISEREKEIIAYHESGHVLVAKLIPGSDPVHKVSIIPRGPALGYTLQLPLEDRYLTSEKEIQDKMAVALGGRVAEELIFNEVTTGAQNDLIKVTDAAQKMVTEYGMSKKLGPLTYRKSEKELFLGRDLVREKIFSEKTSEVIDEEVKRIVSGCKKRVETLLKENIDKLKRLAKSLVEKEVLEGGEIEKIIKGETETPGSGVSTGKPGTSPHPENAK